MRILFIGAVEFSKKTLEKLLSIQANIIGVCTKEKSDFNSDFADLTPLCITNQIMYKYVDDINSEENISWIRTLSPDIIFCFGWSSLIKTKLLNLAPMGIVGYHPSKLPNNRGRHPLIWALALGLKESASTFFFMQEGVDNGDILSQMDFKIEYEDDAQTLYNKVTSIALTQIEQFLPELENKTFITISQDHNIANTWRKRGKPDGKIDFRMGSEAIYNLVRALTKPFIGAHLTYNGDDVAIWKVEVIRSNQHNIESGKVLESNDNYLVIKTYNGAIKIINHEFKVLPKVGEYL